MFFLCEKNPSLIKFAEEYLEFLEAKAENENVETITPEDRTLWEFQKQKKREDLEKQQKIKETEDKKERERQEKIKEKLKEKEEREERKRKQKCREEEKRNVCKYQYLTIT